MKVTWWILGAVVLVSLAVWFLGRNPTDRGTQSSATTPTSQTAPESSDSSTPATDESAGAGQYLTYSGDLSIGTGRRLLFFHAPWCPQCRALEASILATGVPDGVTIIKVDYDSNQSLRQEYGVTIQTTLVEIDASGKLVERYVAYEEPSIAAVSGHFNLK